jgi:hypothetical protein
MPGGYDLMTENERISHRGHRVLSVAKKKEVKND